MRQGKYRFIIGFLAPPILFYAVFVINPYVQAFYIAMTNWRGLSREPDFIGLENFQRLFDEVRNGDTFGWALINHLIILITLPLVTIAIALFFSYLLNLAGRSKDGRMSGVRGSRFYKIVFFLPQVLAVAILAVLFQAIYRPDQAGVLNALLDLVGIGPIGWLTEPNIALFAIIGVMVWQLVGFYVVLFSAAMSSIPKDYFEAAELDGATRFTLFFRITLPLLWDTLQVGWVYLGIMAFDFFAIVHVLSVNQGGPDDRTTVVAVETFKTMQFGKFGLASAMGVSLFLMTITFAALTLIVTRRERVELS